MKLSLSLSLSRVCVCVYAPHVYMYVLILTSTSSPAALKNTNSGSFPPMYSISTLSLGGTSGKQHVCARTHTCTRTHAHTRHSYKMRILLWKKFVDELLHLQTDGHTTECTSYAYNQFKEIKEELPHADSFPNPSTHYNTTHPQRRHRFL